MKRIDLVRKMNNVELAKWLGHYCGKILILKQGSYFIVSDQDKIQNECSLIVEWLNTEINLDTELKEILKQ